MRDTQWRGYARTAEGNPITLSQVRSLANLSALGNSTQDGTPSPDNPVEVVGSGELQDNGYYKITVAFQEAGNATQTFNIYTPQILHGVSDAHDNVVIDFDKNKAKLIKGYEYFKVDAIDWLSLIHQYDGAISTNRCHDYTGFFTGNFRQNDSKCNVLVKYNEQIWLSDRQGFTWNGSQLHIRINNDILGVTESDSTAERTAKFVSYIQNNDIYVLGKLIIPVVTDITALQQWETMPNLKGTWILSANGGTEPTLTAEYYSNERSTE